MDLNFKKKLYSRFEKFVKTDTQSRENSKTYPSTPGQIKLGRILLGELKTIGLKNASLDRFGYVSAELASNTPRKVPAIAFLAHMDTSPDACGRNIKPRIHRNYNGGNLNLGCGIILSPKDSPELLDCRRQDIITASGDTLLGADDKAGLAIILCAIEYLKKNPDIKHGKIKVAFTPDEEIGRGVDRFNVKKFGADCAYTVDGDVTGTLEDENFNADGATIKIKGRNYHPGLAKNLMINAVRVAADIISSWPGNMLPETTEKREGFIMFLRSNASSETAELSGIVRDHDLQKLDKMEKRLTAIVNQKRRKYPGVEITLQFKKQYRNMKKILEKHPRVVARLLSAMKAAGVKPLRKPIRGGTDGARLSFMGLPTPNIFTGGSNFHGKYEWVSLDGMEKSARVLIELAKQWEMNG
ncbi:MAG: peptidase T [bacterium]